MRAFKTEINPTEKQKHIIHQTIGTCRFIYNFYLAHNKEVYEKEKKFVSGINFSKWLNNDFIPNNPEYKWIKDVSSKSIKQSIMNGEKAFKKFFSGKSKFPRFKKKRNQDVKMYFVKSDAKTIIRCERHKIKIPTLGYIHLKEKGYIPTNGKITSGTVSQQSGRYYVGVLVDNDNIKTNDTNTTQGIGIDLGIKDFAVINTFDKPFKNINKTKKIKKLEKKLKREQRKLSRKYESLKKKIKKKEDATRQNISKQIVKVQILHQTLTNIRHNYINQVVNEVVKAKPKHITIEDLNVKGMMKNRHLAKAIAKQNFYRFRIKLENKCKQSNIELRVVSRFYPSSKTCSCCGYIKRDLTLRDRVYICDDCGLEIDRDKNASINLANAKIYKVA